MHDHTKQQLEKFEKAVNEAWESSGVITPTFWDAIELMESFLPEALLSQAEYIKAEMVPNKKEEDCACDGSGKDLHGYCDCGFSYNDCREDINYKLDELINSFK